jgi:hypothetical protein
MQRGARRRLGGPLPRHSLGTPGAALTFEGTMGQNQKRYKSINIDADLHQEVKLLSIADEKTITAIIEALLREHLEERRVDVARLRRAMAPRG